MIKFLSILLLSIFVICNQTFAEKNKNEKVIKNISTSLQKNISQLWPKEKIKNILLLDKYIKKYKNKPEIQQIFINIKNNLYISDFNKYYQNHNKKYNINSQEIENFWIDLHNQKRSQSYLQSFQYNNKLENTSIEWSYNNYFKQSMDHKRDFGDSWYDYNKIEDWFQKRWVVCPLSWSTTTSESIAQYGFYCSDNQCDDEFKGSLQTIFDIYYAEKGLSYPQNAHYLAIMSPNLRSMWMWYTLYQWEFPDYYEYYLTTHYCSK